MKYLILLVTLLALPCEAYDRTDLQAVFDSVKSRFESTLELDAGGDKDIWTPTGPGKFRGDCDEFSREAVRVLREQGYPARLVIAKNQLGDWHMMAEVEGWIFDDLARGIFRRESVAARQYEYWFVSSYEAGGPWWKVK